MQIKRVYPSGEKLKKERNYLKPFFLFLPFFSPLSYFFLILSFFKYFKELRENFFNFFPSFFDICILFFTLSTAISVILSCNFQLSLGAFFLFLIYMMTLLTTRSYTRRNCPEEIVSFLLWGTAVITVFGIIQYYLNLNLKVVTSFFSFKLKAGQGGVTSTLGNPNRFAKYLVLTLPFVLTTLSGEKGLSRLSLILLFIGGCFALGLTRSLGGMGAVGAVFLLFVFRRSKKFGILLVAAGFFLFLAKYDLFLSIINTYGTADTRLYTWENIILPLFKRHPFFGSGLATYREVSRVFTSELVLRHHAHNLYFNYLVEIGIFGLSGLLSVVGWFLKSCLKELRKGHEEKLFLEGCFLAIVGALIHGSVETFIDFFQLGLLFFAIIGLGAGFMEKNFYDFSIRNTPMHMRSTPNTLTRLIFSPRKSQEKRRIRM